MDRVYRYCLARLGNAAVAEDVTGTVFLRALQAIERYESRGAPFAAWLFRIAHNEVINHARRAPKHHAVVTPDIPAATPGPRVLHDRLALTGALPQLTDLQRQVVELRFAAGLSHAEIGELLGKNANAVKQPQHAAVVRLRKILGADPVGNDG